MATTTANTTSRLRKWVCQCATHATDKDRGTHRAGPQVIRAAGDALMAVCPHCKQLFRLAGEAPTGKQRVYRGCAHCSDPSEHDPATHGLIPSAGGDAYEDDDDPAPY